MRGDDFCCEVDDSGAGRLIARVLSWAKSRSRWEKFVRRSWFVGGTRGSAGRPGRASFDFAQDSPEQRRGAKQARQTGKVSHVSARIGQDRLV